MSTRREVGASLVGLLSVILLYLVLTALVLVFAVQVLDDLSFTQSTGAVVVVLLAMVFPGFLVGIIVIRVVRLVRDRAQGRPGARLKGRLLVFFLVIVLLSSVPQAVLSVAFVQAAIRSWFSEDTGRAIAGGQEIALSLYFELESDLLAFSQSPFVPELLSGVDTDPASVWQKLRGVNPALDAFQVFDEQFRERFFGGDPGLRLDPLQAAAARAGQVARESVAGRSFLRVRRSYGAPAALDPSTLTVFFLVALPEGFDASAARLTEALEFFVQLDRFQGEFVNAVRVFYAFFSLPLVMLALLVSFLLSDEILRPIVSLEEATRRVSEGDFSTRILTRRSDELSILVNSFNRMVGELARTRQKIIQAEKIAAWQEIAQRLAHEVKNPLTPIRLAAERTLRKYERQSDDFEDVLRSSVRTIITEVDGLSELLSGFRTFTRLPPPRLESVNLRPIVEEVAAAYATGGTAVQFTDVPASMIARADRGQMRQVLTNVVKNAVEAAGSAGQVSIHADFVVNESGSFCRIQVEDNGPGIPVEQQPVVFDPYMTTKRGGTGLGLSIVQRIVFDHSGQIWFETQPGVGTTFFIDIPADRERDAAGRPDAATRQERKGDA